MQQEAHLNTEVDSVLDDNMITYDVYQNDSEVEAVPTVVSANEADKQSMIAVLQRMYTEIAGYVRVNDEHKLVNATLTAELEWCKIEMQALKRNKLKEQLHERDNSIRNLQAQNDIMSLFNVGSTDDSCNKQALETELTLLKDTITSFKIQNDGYKVTNANLNSPKYIVPQRRTNRETLIPLPKKKQITFQKTPKSSHIFTKKLVAPLLKKPNVNVPLSTGIKSATGASKPASKSNAWIYRKLPAKSAKGEKVEEHIRNLNKNNRVDSHVKRSVSVKNLNAICGTCHECLISSNHDNCLVYSVKSVNRKQPKAKNTVRTTKKVWRPKGWKAGSKGIPAMFEL
nr:hypothetical protein [Tanacetum cinerariifolium]